MLLEITNVSEALLREIENLVRLYPDSKLNIKDHELTINGYTREFEAEILESLREIEEERKNGTLKTYDNIHDLRLDLLS